MQDHPFRAGKIGEQLLQLRDQDFAVGQLAGGHVGSVADFRVDVHQHIEDITVLGGKDGCTGCFGDLMAFGNADAGINLMCTSTST